MWQSVQDVLDERFNFHLDRDYMIAVGLKIETQEKKYWTEIKLMPSTIDILMSITHTNYELFEAEMLNDPAKSS